MVKQVVNVVRQRGIQYAMSGVVATVANLAVVSLLLLTMHTPVVYTSVLGIMVGGVVGFFMHSNVTFDDRDSYFVRHFGGNLLFAALNWVLASYLNAQEASTIVIVLGAFLPCLVGSIIWNYFYAHPSQPQTDPQDE